MHVRVTKWATASCLGDDDAVSEAGELSAKVRLNIAPRRINYRSVLKEDPAVNPSNVQMSHPLFPS